MSSATPLSLYDYIGHLHIAVAGFIAAGVAVFLEAT
jgi:hypothetical protein